MRGERGRADDAALKAKFELGIKVIEAGADQRGFDLETGRQDVSTALSPDLAALHTDQIEEGPTVIRRDRQRQRVRGG